MTCSTISDSPPRNFFALISNVFGLFGERKTFSCHEPPVVMGISSLFPTRKSESAFATVPCNVISEDDVIYGFSVGELNDKDGVPDILVNCEKM